MPGTDVLSRVAESIRSASAILGVAILGGWSFSLVFYGRLGVDPIEVGLGLEGLLHRSFAFFIVVLATGASVVWLAGRVIDLDGGDQHAISVSRNTAFDIAFYSALAMIGSFWLWQLLVNSPWQANAPIGRVLIWIVLLFVPICVSWLSLVVLIRPQPYTSFQLSSFHTFLLVVVVFFLAGAGMGYGVAGHVASGGQVQTPMFRAEVLRVDLTDGTSVGCMHYLGSKDGLSIFFDSSDHSVSRLSTENIAKIVPACGVVLSPEDTQP